MIYLFLIISALNILFQNRQDLKGIYVRRISKALLMPVLLLFYLTKINSVSFLIIFAISFCWLGDLVLMGRLQKNPIKIVETTTSFLLGLSFFLIGHILYTIYFSTIININFNHPLNNGLITILVLYGIVILKGVHPKGSLLIGTIIYTLVIGTMILFAINIFIFDMTLATFSIAAGALLFGSSDTVLAFRDIKKINLPDTYIMFSYIIGQYLIILGILQHSS